jgi:hypothetical protein
MDRDCFLLARELVTEISERVRNEDVSQVLMCYSL